MRRPCRSSRSILRDGKVFDMPPQTVRRHQVENVEPAHHVWRFNEGISESQLRNRRHTLTRHTLTSSHAHSPPRLLFPTLFSSFQCNGSRRSPL